MTRINQLPATSTAIAPADLMEGERVNGESQKWTVEQVVGGYKPMAFRLYSITNQAVATHSIQGVNMGAETFDPWGMHSGTSPRVTIPANGAGLWFLGGWIAYNGSTGGTVRSSWLAINGSTSHRIGASDGQPAAAVVVGPFAMLALNAGDQVEIQVWHDSGVTQNILGQTGPNGGDGGGVSNFFGFRIGAF